jgi:hypothetical protein
MRCPEKYIKNDNDNYISNYHIGMGMSFSKAKILIIIMLYIIDIIYGHDNIHMSLYVKRCVERYNICRYNCTDIYILSNPILTDNYKLIINDKYRRKLYLRKREDRCLCN